jgi:hypothetical protein
MRGEEAAADLAAIPDSPDLKAADEAITTSDNSNEDDGNANSGRKSSGSPSEDKPAIEVRRDRPTSEA